MRKIFLILLLSLGLAGCGNNEIEPFWLEEEYYNNSRVREIGIEEFNELVDSD